MINMIYAWDFSLANYESVWRTLVVLGLLLIALFVGNVLRTAIPFFRKSLIPSALLGGLVLLIGMIVFKRTGVISEETNAKLQQSMQIITYHGLGIGFAAMTLKTMKTKNKTANSKVIENGALTGGTYMLQACVGLLVTILAFLFTKTSDNPVYFTSGLLLPLGFGQGPGNALTWDVNFTNIQINNANVFFGNGSVGLTIASVGFIVASLIGVLYINIMRRKGKIILENNQEAVEKEVSMFESPNEIPDNESVDKFSIQLSLVFIAYAAAFGIMVLFSIISDFTGSLAWGFNFIWGVITANLIKLIIKGLKKANVVKREYINNYQMDRISGFAFDIMIVAGVGAIEIKYVQMYLLPIIILCVVGTITTFIYIKLVCDHCFKGYENEMFVTNFGALTGTASNGMILLKEIDSNFKTPAANLYILSQLPAILFVAPLLLLLNFAAKSFTNTIVAFVIFFVLFTIYTIYLFRNALFKKKNKTEPTENTVSIEKINNK